MLSFLLFLREVVGKIDHAFPVSLACSKRKHKAAKILLFNKIYCSPFKKEADWHGLALSSLKEDYVADISNYERLILGWNQLTKLPQNMDTLVNLVRLDLQNNQLQTVPACLFTLPALRNLNLSFNSIQELPTFERWSSSINYLELQVNFLSTFPENVEGAALQYLSLAQNQLDRLDITYRTCLRRMVCNGFVQVDLN